MKNEIQALRKQKKLTQDELSKILGVSRQTIISIEMGRYSPSLPLAFKISKFFKKSIEKIFYYEEK